MILDLQIYACNDTSLPGRLSDRATRSAEGRRFTSRSYGDSAPYAREVLFDAMVSPLLHASLRLLSLSGAPGHSTLPRAALRRDQLSNLELFPPNPLDYDAR
jgi:hypothetical protein